MLHENNQVLIKDHYHFPITPGGFSCSQIIYSHKVIIALYTFPFRKNTPSSTPIRQHQPPPSTLLTDFDNRLPLTPSLARLVWCSTLRVSRMILPLGV